MNKKNRFDILIGIIFLALLGLYFSNHFLVPSREKKRASYEVTKANDILKRKIKIPEKILNFTVTSSACTLFLKNTSELSMIDYINEFMDHAVDEIIKTCTGAVPSQLQVAFDRAMLDCKSSTRDNITRECYTALLDAKSISVSVIIKADVDPKDLAAPILLHLISEKFMNGDLINSPDKSLLLIDALLEKEPNFLSGHKLKLLLLSTSSLSKNELYKDFFQEALDEAKRINPNDAEIREIELVEKRNKPEFLAYLASESAGHANEWIYDYYKADAIYNDGAGDYKQTLALIEKCLKIAPNDTRLKRTLSNLKSDNPEIKQHPFIIGIGFSLNDL